MDTDSSLFSKIRRFVIGGARNPKDPKLFHKISLTAFLAWIGFGLDGVSSSCYGPSEAFLGLQGHHPLSLFLAVMTIITVLVISASYNQIIELFPSGGGGYLVASKLLSPTVGMISGSALIVDYILTITVSIAAGVDAVFSFLPLAWGEYKLAVGIGIVIILMIMNLRGVRESIVPLIPIFLLFLGTHGFAILYGIITHGAAVPDVVNASFVDFRQTAVSIGTFGAFFIVLHAYSVGSGTYTGIEAVSNGMPMLRDPKVKNGKKTTLYMAVSLCFMAGGLLLNYLLYGINPETGKTLNTTLMDKISFNWPGGNVFVFFTILSEALVLLVAAQTGFLGGPRVMSNMALDRWLPYRFAHLSDRLVTQNGVVFMSVAAIALLIISKGNVSFLVVLYSINVFLTFTLSQLGMVRHWWQVRKKDKKFLTHMITNSIGLLLTSFILVTNLIVKFFQGGLLTIFITASLVGVTALIRYKYKETRKLLTRLDSLAKAVVQDSGPGKTHKTIPCDQKAKTAFILVNGFQGVSLHTLFSVIRNFKGYFKNFIFLQVGLLDAGAFKGIEEIENMGKTIMRDIVKYKDYMNSKGFYAEIQYSFGTDVVDEVEKMATALRKKFPDSVLFTGKLVFQKESFFDRILHNYAATAIQSRLYQHEIPVMIMPIRVTTTGS